MTVNVCHCLFADSTHTVFPERRAAIDSESVI